VVSTDINKCGEDLGGCGFFFPGGMEVCCGRFVLRWGLLTR